MKQLKILTTNHKKAIVFILVALLSAGTMFFAFNRQKTSVFDEIYFGDFAKSYQQHTYFFDIHPPLAKLLLSASTHPQQIPMTTTFANGTDSIPNDILVRMRLLPALAGFMLPIVGVGVAYQIRLKHRYALLTGVLLALENARIAQSRLILLDSMLLLFGISSLWMAIRYYQSGKVRHLAAAGVLAGLAGSIKWTALCYLFFVGVIAVVKLWQTRKRFTIFCYSVLLVLLIPFSVHYATYAIHFAKLTKSGTGDAFMSQNFQKTLRGNYHYDKNYRMSTWAKFIEINKVMYTANKSTGPHPYSSKWYQWPIMGRSIYYYVSGKDRIYFLGNPVIWYLATINLAAVMVSLLFRHRSNIEKIDLFILAAFLASWLPFILIGRVMFLYHYLTPLLLSILLLARSFQRANLSRGAYLAVVCTVCAGYLWYSPITYGLPLSEQGFERRMIFQKWR